MQEGQPVRVQVWCESAGMLPQLMSVADRYSVSVYSSSGFISLTAVRQIVDSCLYDTAGPTVLLHLGDCDPSGYSIFQAMYEDAAAFLGRDQRFPEQTLTAETIAMTPEQIEAHGLVFDDITTRDKRSVKWKEQGRTKKVELEALAPDVIASVLAAAIESHLDMDKVAAIRNLEAANRDDLGIAARAATVGLVNHWRGRATERAA